MQEINQETKLKQAYSAFCGSIKINNELPDKVGVFIVVNGLLSYICHTPGLLQVQPI